MMHEVKSWPSLVLYPKHVY